MQIQDSQDKSRAEHGEEDAVILAGGCASNGFRLLKTIEGNDNEDPGGHAPDPLSNEHIDSTPNEIEQTANMNIMALRQHHIHRVRQQHADVQQSTDSHELACRIFT